MAGTYVNTRQRMLLGGGKTFVFRARRRRSLLGDTTDVDPVSGLPCDDPRANCTPDIAIAPPPPIAITPGQPLPPTNIRPILPTPQVINVGPAPVLTPSVPAPTIVFPSQGPVAPVAPPVSMSWLDQQMIAGFPNKYLALSVIGVVFFFSMASAKRRR